MLRTLSRFALDNSTQSPHVGDHGVGWCVHGKASESVTSSSGGWADVHWKPTLQHWKRANDSLAVIGQAYFTVKSVNDDDYYPPDVV